MRALLALLLVLAALASVASEGEVYPACNSTFTCPNPNNATDIATFPSVLNETDCLAACIYCTGDNWRCSDFRKHTHNKLQDNSTVTKYECRCARWNQGCVEDEWRQVCVDEGYDSPNGAVWTGASTVVGLVSMSMFSLVWM